MSSGWTRAYVGLGANLGDRRGSLEGAVARLRAHPEVVVLAVSDFLDTAPMGGPPGQPDYLNGVLCCRTTLGARDFLRLLQVLETEFGRDRAREERWGPRTLDLDLLLYGDERSADPELELPHPRLEDRLFVLEPLRRIAPELVLPLSGKSVRERAAELAAGHREAGA